MNILFLSYSIFGGLYLIYSVLCRNKVTLYNRDKYMVIIKPREFFRLQLYFSVVNSLHIMIAGIILSKLYVMLNKSYYITCLTLVSVLLFHFINSLFKVIGKGKGYLKYNKERFIEDEPK